MRQALIEIKETEDYLFNRMPEEEKALFNVRLLLQPELQEKLEQQKTVYRLIRLFGRGERRRKLEGIFTTLMKDKTFAQEIKMVFK
jgi:hypothetical protein